MDELRLYDPESVGPDGYPPEWHKLPAPSIEIPDGWEIEAIAGIKHIVRAQAGHRCIRCGHPWPLERSTRPAGPEWSPCDERCTHGGPVRLITPEGDVLRESPFDQTTDLAPIRAAYPTCTIEAQWRVLTVHHLNEVKYDCRWWNLVALCQRCHLTIQRKVQMARVYPFEHTDWFKPYVAGYYAFVYLGEELERPVVEARLEELLALERAA